MKNLHFIIVLGCVMLCLTSCYTSTKFMVYGEPGTQIMTPEKETLATIDNTGKVRIVQSDECYNAFLLSHKPGTEDYIPFALDYKFKTYLGAEFVKWTGYTIGVLGMGTMAVGAIGAIASMSQDDEELTPTFAGVCGLGAAIGLVGGATAWIEEQRTDQDNHDYCYKYLPVQQTNQDIRLTKPVFESAKVNDSGVSVTPSTTVEPKESDDTISNSSESNKKLVSSSTFKKLKDYASKIEGSYVGSGTLKQGNEVIEDYSSITITLKRKSKDIVFVNVVESDGSKFFTTDGEYNIKQSNEKYILTLKEINNATIKIDMNNNLIYIHPRVNIEGEIYELNINAKK